MFCLSDPEYMYFSLCETIDMSTRAASLRLLDAIEQTVDSLASEQAILESHINMTRSLMIGTGCVTEDPIDPDDKITDKIEQTERLLLERLAILKARRASALSDPELIGDHEDAVVMEFERTYNMLAELIEAFSILRNQIKEHDASLDERSTSFDNVTDLVAYLRN